MSILKLEHEIDALEQHNAELAEEVKTYKEKVVEYEKYTAELVKELATYKAKVAEYAGIVKEQRRDMVSMARIIYELWKGAK